jgi:hypothetical protein
MAADEYYDYVDEEVREMNEEAQHAATAPV